MKRRDFIKTTAIVPSAINSSLKMDILSSGIQSHIFNTKWGFSGSYDTFFKKCKEAGYDGVELGWPYNREEDQKEVFEGLKKYDLEVGFLCQGFGANAQEHYVNYEKMLNQVITNSSQRPLYINCHGGKDFFSFEENAKIIEFTLALEQKSGVEIFHETHRGRMCFAAQITRGFIEKYEKMKINLDISHWTNVHESLLEDQKETLDKVFNRVGLIHTRVGHQESPQVNDPRAPEWASVVDLHYKWWDQCVANRIKNGHKHMYFLTEFGPPNYMPTLPYTQQALSSQWDINVFMLNQVRKHYKV